VAWSTAKGKNPTAGGAKWKEDAQQVRIKFLSCILILCIRIYVKFMSEYMSNVCQNICQIYVRIYATFMSE